jgi:hypothetical protein
VPRHRIVPAARMKGTLARTREDGGKHVVPLSMEATEVLLAMRDLGGRLPLILPNQRRSHEPTSENSMGYLLNRVRYHGRHIPHGFRAASSMIMNELASRGGRASDAGRRCACQPALPGAGCGPVECRSPRIRELGARARRRAAAGPPALGCRRILTDIGKYQRVRTTLFGSGRQSHAEGDAARRPRRG